MRCRSFACSPKKQDEVFTATPRNVDFTGPAFYGWTSFMHVDLKAARRWGERFTVRTTAYAAKNPSAREVLPDSHTMKDGGEEGVTALGSEGGELVETRADRSLRWRMSSLKPAYALYDSAGP